MKSLFGTDGIRGVAGTYPLDEWTVYACARSLAAHLERILNRPPHVVIGRDTRESGRWIEGIVTRGLRDFGAEVLSAGVITTPGVAYLTRSELFDAGVVISASHNPVPDNGIKMFSAAGIKLEDELERAIEADIQRSTPPTSGIGPCWLESEDHLRRLYVDYLTQEIGRDLDLGGSNLMLDCAHGAAYEIAPAVFMALGANVQVRAAEPDGKNINQDCGAVHTEILSQWMRQDTCDLGIAFDGDADRALFVGRDGFVFDGDHTMFVVANYLKERGRLNQDLVVGTVMSNWGLEKALQVRGIKLYRTQVGDRYVLETLLELDGSIGGEQSGHIIFPRISLAGDGIITALEMLRIFKETGSDFYHLTRDFTQYPQVLINVLVKSKPPFESIPPISSQVRYIEEQLEGRGRLLLRYSGTEDKARVMIEADDPELVQRLANQLADTIRDCLG
ncbi:MAG: phosphoglucosamine mutase [Acidobacteria bacterium]|nr:phosphoglucosamine mutase [Acidobacteriota bacterium]